MAVPLWHADNWRLRGHFMSQELKILIIEDVPRDAEAIVCALQNESLRFQARRVETGEAFLAELKSFAPDIVLSDFTLPEFDALQALRLLQEHQYDIPFILVTGTRSEEVAVECLREGADDYILKASLKQLLVPTQSGFGSHLFPFCFLFLQDI